MIHAPDLNCVARSHFTERRIILCDTFLTDLINGIINTIRTTYCSYTTLVINLLYS